MFKSCDKLSGSYINYNHKLKATALKTICFKSLVIKVQKIVEKRLEDLWLSTSIFKLLNKLNNLLNFLVFILVMKNAKKRAEMQPGVGEKTNLKVTRT